MSEQSPITPAVEITSFPPMPESIARRLALISSLCLEVESTAENKQLNSKYAKYLQIGRKLRQHLRETGLGFSVIPANTAQHGDRIRHDNGKSVMEDLGFTLRARVLLTDIDGASWQATASLPLPDKNSGVNSAQVWGIAFAYLRRYIALGLFNVLADKDAGDEDDDAAGIGGYEQRGESPKSSAQAHWSAYLRGAWRTHSFSGVALDSAKSAQVHALYQANPGNNVLMGWAGDLIVSMLGSMEATWQQYVELDKEFAVPDKLVDCTPEQLSSAYADIGKRKKALAAFTPADHTKLPEKSF